VIEFLLVCLEMLNYKIGGKVYALSQVEIILKRIVNELSVEIDCFLDKLC
jgi:hypothetical protein